MKRLTLVALLTALAVLPLAGCRRGGCGWQMPRSPFSSSIEGEPIYGETIVQPPALTPFPSAPPPGAVPGQ